MSEEELELRELAFDELVREDSPELQRSEKAADHPEEPVKDEEHDFLWTGPHSGLVFRWYKKPARLTVSKRTDAGVLLAFDGWSFPQRRKSDILTFLLAADESYAEEFRLLPELLPPGHK